MNIKKIVIKCPKDNKLGKILKNQMQFTCILENNFQAHEYIKIENHERLISTKNSTLIFQQNS